MRHYSRVQLENMTVAELRSKCVYELAIPGMSKQRKSDIIDAILAKVGVTPEPVQVQVPDVTAIEASFQSTLTKPDARKGDKTTTTIRVSCGASSGAFDVGGKTVGAVADFLREVLNIDSLASGIVNGEHVNDSYALKPGDNLEFLKPAGSKGC